MAQYGGSERSSVFSYASDGTRITHNYTITHVNADGKVWKIDWYETPYGRPFGLGGDQHIGTLIPASGTYTPTVNGYPDADAYGSSVIGQSNIMSLAQESTKDAIQEIKTNNNTDNLTASEIATQSIHESRDIFNLNSTVSTAPGELDDPIQGGADPNTANTANTANTTSLSLIHI